MISETKVVETKDNIKLNCQMIENGSPVWIIVTHGLGEHAARHSHFFKMFSQYFSVCIYDLRGHGNSEGERANVDSFDDFVEDLDDVVQFLRKEYDMKRHILFGHSMGGLITSAYMQQKVSEDFYPEKVFLSSPAVAASGALGEFFRISPLKFNRLLANAPVSIKLKGVLDLKKLSHDPRVYGNYVSDPLNILKIHSHLFLEILAKSREVFSRPLRIKSDLYVAIGSEDVLVNAKACIEYFQKVEKHAKLYVSKGGWHELHNETERFRKPYLEFLEESIMDSIYT
ncbi:MAG: lysophospholipase [Bacteriovoracaceae bacterium]|nr:lysophospholipase [Bacteriovoracaceae bacterium]